MTTLITRLIRALPSRETTWHVHWIITLCASTVAALSLYWQSYFLASIAAVVTFVLVLAFVFYGDGEDFDELDGGENE